MRKVRSAAGAARAGQTRQDQQEQVRRMRAELRAAVDRHEQQAQELTVTNEELQVINEELRASTENLEASKAELESLNDQLRLVNDELIVKFKETTQASEVIQNLINSTAIGTVFLDRWFRIRLYTPTALDIFELVPSDLGRRLSDVRNGLLDDDLVTVVGRVLAELIRIEQELETRTGRWHLMRALPYRTANGQIDGVVLTFLDITERKRAETLRRQSEEALQQAHAELERRVGERTRELARAIASLDNEVRVRREAEDQIRGLVGRLITAQEDERRRIARDLHDHLGQQTVALRLKLEALRNATETRELPAAIDAAEQVMAKLDRDLDFFTWELRPPILDDLGVRVALGNFVREWSRSFGIPAEFHTRGLEHSRLPPDVETGLYRIAQEALNNVYKHAKATRVAVILERRRSQARLVIEDNGSGFDREATGRNALNRGLGLVGMSERAALIGGLLEIETAPDHGTTIFVTTSITIPDEV